MEELHIWGGIIRKMWFPETEKFRDHLLRLDRDSRRMRFGMCVDESFIASYAERSAGPGSLVYGYFVEGEMRGAAELRMIGDGWPADAEGAFSVEKDFQDRGVGTGLLERIVRAARNRGISRLYMNCLAENRRMQHLARKFEAELTFDHGEVLGKVNPHAPAYLSLWNEAVDDSNSFVMAVLDFPLSLKPAA
jgi:GNAT superfamily N-acetyltransferase